MGYYDPQNNFDPKKFYDNQNQQNRSNNFPLADQRYSGRQGERGGCLSVFLIFLFGINLFFLFMICNAYSELSSASSFRYNQSAATQAQGVLLFIFGIGCVQLGCIAALWNYKAWGYYGMMIGYGLSFVLNICGGQILTAVGNIVFLGILYALVQPIQESLE